uniref:G_PROTEIN_RECEP_F1_2 domain-containing protein n=1 Tax=Steinernema glaseri TaxID=37863 RepID=A0A1I7ZF59_9BILA
MSFLNEPQLIPGEVDYCDLGQQMSKSVYYRCLMAVRVVVCFSGMLLCGSLLLSKLNSVILHVHARILMKYHIIISFLLSVNYLWLSIFEIIRYSRDVPACEYLLPRWLSFSPHFVNGNLIFCEIFSCLLITIERLICTIRIRTYENVNHGKTIIFGLVVMTAVILVSSYFCLARTANWELKFFFFSFRDKSNLYYAVSYVFLQFCMDLVTIVICKIVDVVNTRTKEQFVNGTFFLRRNLFHNQLSSKLQIRENIALSHTLMPIVGVHFLFTSVSVLVIAIAMLTLRNNVFLNIIIAESFSLFPVYSVAMPTLFYRKHPSLFWKLAEKVCRRKFRRVDVRRQDTEEAFDHHFKWFDKMLEDKQMPSRL